MADVTNDSLDDLALVNGTIRVLAIESPLPLGIVPATTAAHSILTGGDIRRGLVTMATTPLTVDGQIVRMYAPLDAGDLYYLRLPLPVSGELNDVRQILARGSSETQFGRAVVNGYGLGTIAGNGVAYLQGFKHSTIPFNGYPEGIHIWPNGRPSHTLPESRRPVFLPAAGADLLDMLVVDQNNDGLDDLVLIGTSESGETTVWLNRAPIVDEEALGHPASIRAPSSDFVRPRMAVRTIENPAGGRTPVVAASNGARIVGFPQCGSTDTDSGPLLQASLTSETTAVLAAEDLDSDGFTDVVVASVSGSIGVLDVFYGPLSTEDNQTVYEAGSSWTFATEEASILPRDAQTGDLNGDDRPGLAVTIGEDIFVVYGTGQSSVVSGRICDSFSRIRYQANDLPKTRLYGAGTSTVMLAGPLKHCPSGTGVETKVPSAIVTSSIVRLSIVAVIVGPIGVSLVRVTVPPVAKNERTTSVVSSKEAAVTHCSQVS
jgi:hypothetical protein